MALEHEKTIGDRVVRFKELTVREIRDWLVCPPGAVDAVDALLFEDMALADLTVLTDLVAGDFDDLAPSQIEAIIAEAKRTNPRFFAIWRRLTEAAAMTLPATAPTGSNEPSPA